MTHVCVSCKHWAPEDSYLREYGYGLCNAQPDRLKQASNHTSCSNVCRIKRWEKADDKTIARRAKDGSVVL